MTPANCQRWRIAVARPCECGRHVLGDIRPADCHPERPNIAGGLCGNCYAKQRRWAHRPPAWRPRGCEGHPCDGCWSCERGICCRSDDAGYRLPQPGDIEVSYGALGTITEDAQGQQCHICGDWFQLLHKHAYHAHDLTPAEYRSAFGLAWQQPLTAPTERGIRGERLKPWWQTDGVMVNENRPTSEQASQWSSRPERLQVRERKRPMRERLAREVLANAPRPPTYPHTEVCEVCGSSYRVPPSAVVRGRRTCGSDACTAEVRRGRKPTNAKLDQTKADLIREALSSGAGSQSEIARRFGVTQSLVSKIHRRVIWR